MKYEAALQDMFRAGKAEGKKIAQIKNLRALMKHLECSLDEAMDILDVPADTRDYYRKAINENAENTQTCFQSEPKEDTENIKNSLEYPDYKSLEFGEEFPDGRLTEPFSGKMYRIREAILLSKRLGRPLTDEEMAQFEIPDEQ